MALGALLFIIGCFFGGYGSYPTPFGLYVLSASVAILGLGTLLWDNQTVQMIAGSGMLLYGIWWLVFPNIEAKYNIMTATLLLGGSFVLFYSWTHPPKQKLNKYIYLAFLVVLAIAAVVAYHYFGSRPMP